jgi:hypothetical protein
MKRLITLIAILAITKAGFAQTDTTSQTPDTVKVGNFVIIKKDKDGEKVDRNYSETWRNGIHIGLGKNTRTRSRVSTNYFIFDLGFANYRDETTYPNTNPYLHLNAGDPAFTKDDFELRSGKSSNFNLWFFMQKLNVTKNVVNLKYGLGLEMYNFRYKKSISYSKDPEYVFRDKVTFEKNKLFASYLTVPLMINIDATPTKKRGFSFSGGVSAGYLVGSRSKQVGGGRGKEKVKGDLGLEKFRLAYIGELGLGPVRLYGSYSVNPLHEEGLKQYPYAVGLRLSNW